MQHVSQPSSWISLLDWPPRVVTECVSNIPFRSLQILHWAQGISRYSRPETWQSLFPFQIYLGKEIGVSSLQHQLRSGGPRTTQNVAKMRALLEFSGFMLQSEEIVIQTDCIDFDVQSKINLYKGEARVMQTWNFTFVVAIQYRQLQMIADVRVTSCKAFFPAFNIFAHLHRLNTLSIRCIVRIPMCLS